jgi:hypothetical protein
MTDILTAANSIINAHESKQMLPVIDSLMDKLAEDYLKRQTILKEEYENEVRKLIALKQRMVKDAEGYEKR